MEAMQISTTASRHFSATLGPYSTNRSPTKPTKLATSWASSASTNLASLSSRNFFTVSKANQFIYLPFLYLVAGNA